MARERDDDYTDGDDLDAPRRGRDDFDDRGDRGRDDFDDRPRRGGSVEAAKSRLKPPAIFLLIIAGLGLVLTLVNVVAMVAAPRQYNEFIFDSVTLPMLNMTPPGPQRDQQIAQARAQVAAAGVNPISVAYGVFQLALNAIIVLGATRMLSVSGWGIALAGAIVAIVPYPVTSCCCLNMPFGIWALVVLLNSDVKSAFQSASRG